MNMDTISVFPFANGVNHLYYFKHQDRVWFLDEQLGKIELSRFSVGLLTLGLPNVTEVPVEELPLEVIRKIAEFCL